MNAYAAELSKVCPALISLSTLRTTPIRYYQTV